MIVTDNQKPCGIVALIMAYMKRYHVSQHEMTGRCGIAQSTLSRYFTGKKYPTSQSIDRMLAGLEVEAKLVPLPLPMPDLDNLDDW